MSCSRTLVRFKHATARSRVKHSTSALPENVSVAKKVGFRLIQS